MKIQRTIFLRLSLLLAFCTAVFCVGCSAKKDPWKKVEGDGPKVLVSFTPLYCFVKNVGGEHVRVLSLTTTVGPHDYSPSSHDAIAAGKADLFLVNGLGLDEWVTGIKNTSNNSHLKVVKIGAKIPLKQLLTAAAVQHEGHVHPGGYDPHVWLGIEEAIIMVNAVRDELSKAAPEHKNHYVANAKKYIGELNKLKIYGQSKFKGKTNPRIIATHDSLRYFGKSFGVTVVDNLMPSPGKDASPVKLTKLIKLCTAKKDPVRVITVEPQYSRATAQTLINQVRTKKVDIEMVEFDTLETAPSKSEQTKDLYVKIMRKNIDELAKALK